MYRYLIYCSSILSLCQYFIIKIVCLSFCCLICFTEMKEKSTQFTVEYALSRIHYYRCHTYLQLIALTNILHSFISEHPSVSQMQSNVNILVATIFVISGYLCGGGRARTPCVEGECGRRAPCQRHFFQFLFISVII